ncbi:MAG: YHS domain-containing protein [Myxococcales bacterium]|nr:YHS domain-containing protein [Myxococcales bacterium]
MSNHKDFSAAIEARLSAVAERNTRRRQATEAEMAHRRARLAAFANAAAPLRQHIDRRLRTLASYFENATLLDDAEGATSVCRFEHTPRFPATAKLSLSLAYDAASEEVTLAYDFEILPVLIEYQRHDQLFSPLEQLDVERATRWVEQKLVECLDTYMQLETSPRYHRGDLAVDPVCGMQIRKADAALHIELGGNTIYFCAKACYEQFVADQAGALTTKEGQQ